MSFRTLAWVFTLTSGLAVAAAGLVLSAGLGQPDPRVAFAPTIFVLGLMLALTAPVLYELLRDR